MIILSHGIQTVMLLLLLLSRFSRVRLYATPETAAHQAPPSLGFSRQEHWSGLPFLSPMHEGEKWKWSRSVASDSSRPHGLQPTRLLHPWDFPGKSTGVGCHCLLCCSKQQSKSESRSVVFDPLQPHGLYSPWNSPGQDTGVGSLSLLQGIFPTQGQNPGLPYCRQILYQLSHQGSSRILEWVAYPFSSRSSWPRNWTRVSCIAGRFFINWTTRESQ